MSVDDCHIYVVAASNGASPIKPVKVGISRDPVERLQSLQAASPIPLILFSSIAAPSREVARSLEAAFHIQHADSRLHGEWFNLDPFEATRLMCDNYEAFLRHQIDADIRPAALIFSGVPEIRRLLHEAGPA